LINAFDKDPGRFTVLKERLKRAGATCVSPVLSDFIQINPGDYGDTEYILVDPSCSGSGILKRLSYHNNEASSRRLAKLSSFQFKVLQHALRFPVVKRVVYSTCSVHKEENEMVVHKALQEFAPTFELEYLLPEWSCRGLPLFPDDC
jgi:putative methyltransferase